MKKIWMTLVMAACLCVGPAVQGATAAPDGAGKPFTIPEATGWKATSGQFELKRGFRLVLPGKVTADARMVAAQLADDYAMLHSYRPEIVEGKATDGDVVIKLGKNKTRSEKYTLEVSSRNIMLQADARQGLYYATRTLLQLTESGMQLACGKITDAPAYRMRGFMLDCGRKYIPMSYLKKLVRVMAYYKMNTLQVHLNDNGFKQYFDQDWSKTYAAFRLESDKFPGLAAPDGHYTKAEFRDFQRYADSLGVEIIPEIDVPAHSLAFSQYKPEIGSKKYGMDHLDLFNPETYAFVDTLFSEYLEGPDPVFIGPRVNVGTDEYSNADKQVVEKFREFTDHCIRLVEKYGKQAHLWGALTHAAGQTPVKSENVLMNIWHNPYAQPRDMAKQGYQLVSIPDGLVYIVPAAGYYYDYLNIQHLYDNWTPAQIADQKFEEGDPQIEGGMFAVWNDHVGNGISVSDIHHRIMPSLQTMAAKMWTASAVSFPFETFNKERRQLSEAPGVNELGYYPKAPGGVVEQHDVLRPNTTLTRQGIGYDYAVSFTLEASDAYETPGTVLLTSDYTTFYLADPVSGMMGFARDGYLYRFRYRLEPGTSADIRVEGTNNATRLYVNGKLVDNLTKRTFWFDNKAKSAMNYLSTLFFPLKQTGNFKATVKNFKAQQVQSK